VLVVSYWSTKIENQSVSSRAAKLDVRVSEKRVRLPSSSTGTFRKYVSVSYCLHMPTIGLMLGDGELEGEAELFECSLRYPDLRHVVELAHSLGHPVHVRTITHRKMLLKAMADIFYSCESLDCPKHCICFLAPLVF
jgi:hypothetical protein